jgi:hypothetical protein
MSVFLARDYNDGAYKDYIPHLAKYPLRLKPGLPDIALLKSPPVVPGRNARRIGTTQSIMEASGSPPQIGDPVKG